MSDRRKSRRSYSRSRSRSRSRSKNSRKQSKTSSHHYSSSSNHGSSSNNYSGSSSSRRNNESSSYTSSSKNSSSTHASSRNDSHYSSSHASSSSNNNSKDQKSSSKSSSHKESKKSSHSKKDNSRSRSRSKSRHRNTSRSPSQDDKRAKQTRDKLQSSSQQWNFKAIYEESKWLFIENLPETVEQKDIEEKLTQVSADCGTSIFDEIKLVPYMGSAYILYPSVSAASKTLYHLKGKVKLNEHFYQIDFYNTAMSASGANGSKGVSAYDTVQTDWICDKCEYKNFAKRSKCNKCEKPRSASCRQVLSNMNSKLGGAPNGGAGSGAQGELTSTLMIRGSVILTINESHLMDAFEHLGKIKDVRLVKNKQTMQQKDFAFVEFYTIEDAERAFAATNVPEFKIAGENVTVVISRSKKSEDTNQAFVHPPPPYDYQQQYPGQAGYDYSQYYQQMYQQYGQQPTHSTYIDYDAVGYSAYDQQQQQLQQAYQTTEQILPTSPYKAVQHPVQYQNQFNPAQQPIHQLPNNPLQPAQQQQTVQAQQQMKLIPNTQTSSAQQNKVQSTLMNLDTNFETFDQSDLIKQALENVKNHSITLQQQKDEQNQKLAQQQQEEQKKKEQSEKNLQIQKTMDEQKRILEEQQKALKKNIDDQKMKDISQKIKEEQIKQEQRLEKLKQFSKEEKNKELSQDKLKSEENNNTNLLQFEANAFNSTSSTTIKPTKTIDISLSHSQQKEKLYLCTICKRKFQNDQSINIHYSHSKMHKDNLKLYGIY